MGLNFFGLNLIKALVWAGIVQGFSTPFLMPLTNNRGYREWVNTTGMKVLGWTKTVLIFSALARLVVAWFR